MREKAYYEFAAAAGLKSPRSGFAALYINDEYWGLYILTEVVNGDFLKTFFGKGEDGGNLYKADIGTTLNYLGEDPAPYKQFLEKQSNEEADDWSDVIALTKTLTQTPIEELPAALEPLVDIDSVLTALAVDNLTVNLDSYVGMGQNFYIYRRPSDSRWVWIPWDPSLAFGALAQGLSVQQMKELPLEWVATGGFGGGGGIGGGEGAPAQITRPLATRLWEVPAYKERYRTIYKNLVDNVFFPANISSRMTVLRDMIRPLVEADTQKLVTQEQFEQAMTTDQTQAPAANRACRLSRRRQGLRQHCPRATWSASRYAADFAARSASRSPRSARSPGLPGQPGQPGQPDRGGMGAAPGITPFLEGRLESVKAQLANQ